MDERQRRTDDVRRERSELENHLIDEYAGGKISRREFVRRGTVVGMSLPMLSFLAAACGGGDEGGGGGGGGGQAAKAARGGTIRTAIQSPAGDIDPVTIADEGGLAVLGQTGEYLTFSNEKLVLEPQLAESWKPNEDGTVWTFKLRQGVKYHDGGTVTAKDVVATFDRLSDPKVGSNALSALGGVLSKGNTKAVDDATVEFTLDAPNGSFPYIVSSDNYNAIILPASYDGGYAKTFPGTGPWRLERFQPNVGVSFTKNPDYWDRGKPLADRNEIKFYAEEQPRVLAVQGNEVDVIAHFSVSGGQGLLDDPSVNVVELRSSVHRQIHMRTDKEPFNDKRVRQAMALALDRKAIVDGLLGGKADIGNDSPFAPVYPFTDKTVPQRAQDLEQAKQLVSAAGADGGSAEITTFRDFELPDLAVLIQNAAKEIGLNIKPNLMDQAAYYGDAVYGKSPWLDSVMGITDYGHRGVPNVFLVAPLKSEGTWNSAHFKNKEYDALVTDYIAALDLEAQRSVAGKIQRLLLDETPIIFPYFYFYLFAVKKNFTGVRETAMGHINLRQAGAAA
ncbi:MAG: ABC transporter substrate-binding protein [Thermoleophilia bacterium]|nr:ABC transporter substrate-binding protein [Thermoleophilia bacterium]